MKTNMKEIIAILITGYITMFFSLGVLVGSINRAEFNKAGCEYKSYASIYNPAFLLGCELVKDRTK